METQRPSNALRPGHRVDLLHDGVECLPAMLEAIASGKFYILCPDNDVTTEMDAKRIAWAAGDMIARDVPLSRWDPKYKEAFAEYMENGTPSDGVR